MNNPTMNNNDELHNKINRETARIRWSELATFFASGSLITVSPESDLIAVARAVSEDNAEQVQQWMAEQHIGKTTDQQAMKWQQNDTELWAVVIKPWVLVQEIP